MAVRVRFAPSPTGVLHVGGARTALYNYLHARREGGRFVLRIEDTDAARSTAESTEAILEGLEWLGLTWDEGPRVGGPFGPYVQSERLERYRAGAEALLDAQQAYRCWCTPEALDARRAERRGEGAAGYDGRCARLSDDERRALEASGAPSAIRFRARVDAPVGWDDVTRGSVRFPPEVFDDFVILRSDGHPTYNFAAVIDDHAMEITDVIRGDDHISNTPRQLLLYAALGWTPPRFAHVPMILGADGTRLSKRHGATSVAAYRDLGYVPEAMVNFLALLGWSYDGTRELFTLAELESLFRLERVGSNPAVFDLAKLEWMNGQYLKRMDADTRVSLVVPFLESRGFDFTAYDAAWRRAFVDALGDRLKTLADAERYGAFALTDAVEIDAEAWAAALERADTATLLTALADRIEALASFDPAATESATRDLAKSLGAKPGDLMGLARVALTGRKVAPGLFEVMGLLGRERTLGRLREAAGRWSAESQHAKSV